MSKKSSNRQTLLWNLSSLCSTFFCLLFQESRLNTVFHAFLCSSISTLFIYTNICVWSQLTSWFNSNDHHCWLTNYIISQKKYVVLICHLMLILFRMNLSLRENRLRKELMLWTLIMMNFLFKNTFNFYWIIKIRLTFIRLSQFSIVTSITEIFLLCLIAFHFRSKIIFRLMTIQSLLTVYCSLNLTSIKIIHWAT